MGGGSRQQGDLIMGEIDTHSPRAALRNVADPPSGVTDQALIIDRDIEDASEHAE